jgi:IS30 family transposase
MSSLIPGNNKHLSLKDREYIEQALNNRKSFREIARYLCKDPSTISKEVWKRRIVNSWNRGSFNNPYNFCIHRYHCKKTNACGKLVICDTLCRSCHKCNSVCSRFERESCRQIQKAPYVCNGCEKERHRCSIHTKYDYNAKAAQRQYEELLSDSRAGVNLTAKELRNLDRIVKPLIEQGQSPYMILTNHPELGISVKTLYNYIDQNLLLTRNIDLKRKVKFKKRCTHNTQILDPEIFIGRTYKNFKETHADELDFWEMDTVLSGKGSLKCILTLYFPPIELLWAHVMDRCSPGAVKAVFQHLQSVLGDADEFAFLMPIILTDRGQEFKKPDQLENDPEGNPRTSIFYCDPMRSNQKAGIENVHTMLRMILPKGTVFTDLTQWDVRKCTDHINNAPRKNLEGKTPYEMAVKLIGPEILKKMQLRYVAPDQVTLSPKLLRN